MSTGNSNMVFNLTQYRNVLNKRKNRLKREGVRTSNQAAELIKTIAKRLAPRKSGETIRGIRKRKRGNKWIVESWVPGSFKQNLWANRTVPFNRPKVIWNQRRPTRYGDGSHITTGTPGFFNIAVKQVRKKFGRLARKNTQKALKVSVG